MLINKLLLNLRMGQLAYIYVSRFTVIGLYKATGMVCHSIYFFVLFSALKKKNPKKNYYLYDVVDDPRETTDLSTTRADIVELLLHRLQDYSQTAVPPLRARNAPAADPRMYGNIWYPWESVQPYQAV